MHALIRTARPVAMIVVGIVALAACGGGGDDGAEGDAGSGSEAAVPVLGDDAATPDGSGGRGCPVETAAVVTVIGKDVAKEPDSCAWRDSVTLVEVEVFGPGGNGFLETWRDEFSAQHDEVSEVDRGDGGYVGSDDDAAQAYVETDEASYLVFVGSVECFDADQYAQAVVGLVDVILGEQAEPVAAGACPDPATGTATTSAVAEAEATP